MSDHRTCDDPTCATCAERERLAALDVERGLRPAGKLRATIAKIKECARYQRTREGRS